jgi:endonuclease/exonuclease/phosphatase family metal-dependent hydrolase
MSLPRFRVFGLLGAVAVAVPGAMVPPAAAKTAPGPVELRVMTRNLYLGADLGPAIMAFAGDPASVPAAVAEVYAGVQATDFNVRAEGLADEIQAGNPDLVSLQEVATWRTQSPADSVTDHPRPAKTVEYDFLKILLKALKARGLRYRVASSQTGQDVELPGFIGAGLVDVRYTDRDVILARKGVGASRRQGAVFSTLLEIPLSETTSLPVVRTWTSVDAKVGGRKFRFIATHLEDGVEPIQEAQLAEILAGPAATDLPVVMAGDFNTDPVNGYSPAVHADAIAGGFTDSWTEVSGAPGLTWGHAPALDNPAADFSYRLDYVFHSAGITATGADIVGEEPADRVGGLWPSDHAGLVIDLLIQ